MNFYFLIFNFLSLSSFDLFIHFITLSSMLLTSCWGVRANTWAPTDAAECVRTEARTSSDTRERPPSWKENTIRTPQRFPPISTQVLGNSGLKKKECDICPTDFYCFCSELVFHPSLRSVFIWRTSRPGSWKCHRERRQHWVKNLHDCSPDSRLWFINVTIMGTSSNVVIIRLKTNTVLILLRRKHLLWPHECVNNFKIMCLTSSFFIHYFFYFLPTNHICCLHWRTESEWHV